MPRTKVIEITKAQCELLDWIEYTGGKPTAWPARFQKVTLRMLINKGLVVRYFGNNCYALTPVGKAVRANHIMAAIQRAPRLSGDPLVTPMFLTDSAVD